MTPATYPVHVACLTCDPATVFFTVRHLLEHLVKCHPRQVSRDPEEGK